MFQRLKGAIDSRIAEEQARQRLSQSSPSRSTSGARRPAGRDDSPSKRSPRIGPRGRKDGESLGKSPDPSEFEPEFVVGDDDGPSRSATPRPTESRPTEINKNSSVEPPMNAKVDGSAESVPSEKAESKDSTGMELPTDVRVKLRKLDKLESKYHELLRSYRIAHARVQAIEPFETSLKENTPLTSINDPGALVEYLNNMNLKGDMVLDELKRVSNERDSFKHKLAEAEKNAKEAWDEVSNLKKPTAKGSEHDEVKDANHLEVTIPKQSTDGDPLGVSVQSPLASGKSRKGSLASLSIFSPKVKPAGSPTVEEKSEDLFSFDNEVPRMEAEIKEKQEKIDTLQGEVQDIKRDLAVTRESTQSMAESLEVATREVNMLREQKDKVQSELEEQQNIAHREVERVQSELERSQGELRDLEIATKLQTTAVIDKLKGQLIKANQDLEILRASSASKFDQEELEPLQARIRHLEDEIAVLHNDAKLKEKRIGTLNGLVGTLREQLKTSEDASQRSESELMGKIAEYKAKLETNAANDKTEVNGASPEDASDVPSLTEPVMESNTAGKKNKKKKKKGGKSTTDSSTQAKSSNSITEKSGSTEATQALGTHTDTLAKLESELEHLRSIMTEKDTALEKLQRKLKDQDDLKEEIETLRDDLVNIGQEHVEAKDRAKNLLTEKKALEATITELESDIAELKGSHASSAAGSEEKHNELIEQMEDLKRKAAGLQTDLSASEKLANTRFKDITELRAIIQKAQPELASLRAESAELKSVRETLAKKQNETMSLENRQEDLQSEIIKLQRLMTERDAENKTLNQKIAQESNGRLKAEETSSRSSQDIHNLTVEKQHATESIDRLSRELAKAREELRSSKTKLQELDQRVAKLRDENKNLKEEAELKTAQYASAQSLMTSMRDQTTEMATQMKEARERCESLDEEVAEAHRLLSERTREGETMRRLLADVEGRADARTREMKERMDTAIEERDRAEDEASTAGRRRAREIEEMRNKVREAERDLKRVEDDKEELESAQKDWKRRREELERRTEQSTREAEDVRRAMSELRDALDDSERQARDLEKQKADLRRLVDETQQRVEKLQKSNKSMADEMRAMQLARTKAADSGVPSSRSSMDSGPSLSRLGSPAPNNRTTSNKASDAVNGHSPGAMDYVYLKNVLLQFLEQKDKKHQMQLIPVLGMLLHFDRKEEQKWMSAISTR